jgi:hypothetical protein
MPFRWRFFRFSNYFHIGLVLMLMALLIFGWTYEPGMRRESIIFVIAGVGLILLITNSINNLVLLGKYYPEKLPATLFSRYSKFLFGFSLLPLLGIGVIAGYGMYEECIRAPLEQRNPDPSGLTMAMIFVLTFLTGLHACWYQVVLRKTIRRNFDLGLDKFLTDDNP